MSLSRANLISEMFLQDQCPIAMQYVYYSVLHKSLLPLSPPCVDPIAGSDIATSTQNKRPTTKVLKTQSYTTIVTLSFSHQETTYILFYKHKEKLTTPFIALASRQFSSLRSNTKLPKSGKNFSIHQYVFKQKICLHIKVTKNPSLDMIEHDHLRQSPILTRSLF